MKYVRISEIGHEAAAKEAVSVLRNGGIVLYPTDTLYGLGVDSFNAEALATLYALKGRDETKFISNIVSSVQEIDTYAQLNPRARVLAERHLPGPLTLVLPAREVVPETIAPDGAIRIRIPQDTFALSLAEVFAAPYTSTSANVSGMDTLHTPEEIVRQFGDRAELIDLVVDGGARSGGMPSTVVRAVEEELAIVRQGALSATDLGIE